MAWTDDVRLFAGYDDGDPRPPTRARPRPRAQAAAARGTGASASSSRSGTQASDRMVGEPTTYTHDWFDAFGDAVDATPLLAEARAIKTEQEVERMRLANEIAAAAMEHVQAIIEPGMTEAQVAAEWEGFVHGEGTGWEGKVELALGFSLVWSGPGIRTFTATSDRPGRSRTNRRSSRSGSAPTATGATTPRTSSPVSSTPRTASSSSCSARLRRRRRLRRPGASLAELDRRVRAGHRGCGYPGQPSHPICHGVGARAHEPPYAHQAGGGEIGEGMVLAIEPGCYWEGGGGLRVEDNFLITADGAEKLSPFPDGVVAT